MRPPPRFIARVFAIGLVIGSASCVSGPRSPDDAARDVANVDHTLQGSWTLVSYAPDVPLEPLLSGLLALQLNSLAVTFDGGNLDAASPTVKFHRRYRIQDAEGPRFHLAATDDSGVEQVSTAEFSADGSSVDFHGDTDPWRGQGKLVKSH